MSQNDKLELVARLRACKIYSFQSDKPLSEPDGLCAEAADEIERLRFELESSVNDMKDALDLAG